MSKRIMYRFFLGMPFGVTYGMVISIAYAYLNNQTFYQMATNRFDNYISKPLDVLTITVILWALIGSLFFVTALIFTVERWSSVKKIIIHFFVTVSIFMIIAYALGWYLLNIEGVLTEIIIFVIIYALFTINDMIRAKRNVAAINNRIKNKKNS
ncbi:DUF3021 domain-containing protein [Weissella paramesenteroides]|uniref:DUF3021 domain-containing protein n=1 Tax=Weissella paramesenteroides TaxID=1249 RepID=UPI00123B42F7|nr:DUF3021 domain-containing protein [Weissella paramesenteroides]KAA8458055.1 DUF3021 domain-containing protein [Weissella paramesenteroides]KAA8458730.1 DUF3021 domain-containing protein [Weissella paramesenteroides]KAA8459296.1 DUF3021 domain-containing protein [Weissella paramesenteroides]KAA8463294.1 DUF3021 domain-containing protein [Weissella paramesenteroides]KAA8463868.1 DUF3021 domain-containing protein [Weissella paramesenteroides]